MLDKTCFMQSAAFTNSVYSHFSEAREAGEGKRTDALQHVVLWYGAEIGSNSKKILI